MAGAGRGKLVMVTAGRLGTVRHRLWAVLFMLCWSWHPPYHQRTQHIIAFYLFVPKMGPIWETEKNFYFLFLVQ